MSDKKGIQEASQTTGYAGHIKSGQHACIPSRGQSFLMHADANSFVLLVHFWGFMTLHVLGLSIEARSDLSSLMQC